MVEQMAQASQTLLLSRKKLPAKLARCPQCAEGLNILGACAQPSLLSSTRNDRFKLHSSTNKERAYAFGGIELVSCDRQQIHAECVHIHRDFAHRLRGIGMHQGSR